MFQVDMHSPNGYENMLHSNLATNNQNEWQDMFQNVFYSNSYNNQNSDNNPNYCNYSVSLQNSNTTNHKYGTDAQNIYSYLMSADNQQQLYYYENNYVYSSPHVQNLSQSGSCMAQPFINTQVCLQTFFFYLFIICFEPIIQLRISLTKI